MKRENSLEKAFREIKSISVKQDTNLITIQRKYLSEIFDPDLLEISKNDGLPLLKPFVVEYLTMKGIKIKFDFNEVQFKLYTETKKQLETKDNLIKLKDGMVIALENALKLKDETINSLEKTLKQKDEEIKLLKKTIALKEEEILLKNKSNEKELK